MDEEMRSKSQKRSREMGKCFVVIWRMVIWRMVIGSWDL